MERKLILIGGAPLTGKSFLAKKLSRVFDLPWISTDTIRGQMRRLVRKRDYPNLFFFSNTKITAESYLSKTPPEKVVADQNKESLDVWKGVEALIKTDYSWRSFIVEGVAVLPALVKMLRGKCPYAKAVFLIDDNSERIKNIVFTRGLWDDAAKYPDSVKPKEVEWVKAFNRWLVDECKKYSMPVVYIKDRTSYIDEVIKLTR